MFIGSVSIPPISWVPLAPISSGNSDTLLSGHIGSRVETELDPLFLPASKSPPLSSVSRADDWLGGKNRLVTSVIPTTFFDYLVSDMPAYPTSFDGEQSVSNRGGAYHILMGLGRDQLGDRYVFFCSKKATGYSVRFQHPFPVEEAMHITSRYARFWRHIPPGALPPQEYPVPDEYCHYGYLIEQGGPSGRVRMFTCQVYQDWVVFSGSTNTESRVQVTIRNVSNNQIFRTLEANTQNLEFRIETHLPPGEYTYEVCAYEVG